MLVKDLMKDLEKGDRTKEMLTKKDETSMSVGSGQLSMEMFNRARQQLMAMNTMPDRLFSDTSTLLGLGNPLNQLGGMSWR